MIKRILWMALAGAAPADQAPPTEVSFTSDAAAFRAELRGDRFTFFDGRVARTLTVKPCNEKIIRGFWSELATQARASEVDEEARTPKGASLKIDGAESAVGRFESRYYFFNRTPKDAVVVLIQSLRACNEKL